VNHTSRLVQEQIEAGDFRLRPCRQLDFKGGQYLTDEQIVSYKGSDLQRLLHARAIPYSMRG
jgi:hypothetical protein